MIKDNFGNLGNAGEFPIVKAIFEDSEFFLKISSSLKPTAFTNKYLSNMVKIFTDRYKENGDLLDYKSLEILIKNVETNASELQNYAEAFKRLKGDEITDEQLKIAKETAESFFKALECVRVITNFKSSLDKNGYSVERLSNYIQQLQEVEKYGDLEIPVNGDEMIEPTITQAKTERITTGVNELDEIFRGGFPKGAVSLLIAGTGVGKSTLGSIFCCNAAQSGKKVLHIFFEDSKEEISQKYYAHMLNRNTFEFEGYTTDTNKYKEIATSLRQYSHNKNNFLKNCVKMYRMKNGETTIDDIIAVVRKLKVMENFTPDFIFIDYFSCLRTSSNEVIRIQNEWQAMERCMKRIEQFANSENIAILVAQQTNRNGMDEDTANKRMANIQGSYRITQPASIILYLDRTGCEKNRANLYIDKARGCDVNGKTEYENIFLDNGTCQIDLSGYEDNTDEVLGTFTEKEEELKDNKLKLINNEKDSKQD